MGSVEEWQDGFAVHGPTKLKGDILRRVTMHACLAIAGLFAEDETAIENSECKVFILNFGPSELMAPQSVRIEQTVLNLACWATESLFPPPIFHWALANADWKETTCLWTLLLKLVSFSQRTLNIKA
jgi:hypothetical protein